MSDPAFYASSPPRRLDFDWLIRLRWLALAGVAVGAVLAQAGLVPGVNVDVVALAVVLGIVTNLWLWRRSRQPQTTDDWHFGQALLDTGALTLVIWAAGGAECPFVAFYVFPVLLATLLGGRDALWVAGAASAAGLGFQLVVAHVPALQVGRWNPLQPWDEVLMVSAVALTVGMAAYFASVYTEALRSQAGARREADAMVRLAFEGLDAGLEVVVDGAVVWQNPRATDLLGLRAGGAWSPPGTQGEPPCPPTLDADQPHRCQFTLKGPTGLEHIFELLSFPLPRSAGRVGDRHMVLYVDRTTEVLDQRQLMFTERLASLGRTVQGVAHELNTPLATIQTLGRDVLDVMGVATLADDVRADLSESATMIVDEVQRCRRITHALLGRMEHLEPTKQGLAGLGIALDRSIAVVFTHERDRVEVIGEPPALCLPLDPVVQIFVNLLQNARDAAPDASVTVRFEDDDDGARVTIRDRGPGLPSDVQPHLFEPFFTTKPPGKGTGLGLYTSYSLAHALGADLSLGNHPDGGAVATLSVPSSSADASL